jgi:hypothetical protein
VAGFLVEQNRFCELGADTLERVEAEAWFLKHHAGVAAGRDFAGSREGHCAGAV